MAQLAYAVENKIYTWKTTSYLNYTTSYNSMTNQTTVTFESCDQTYWGTDTYGTSVVTNIKVTAVDNTSSVATSYFELWDHTNGGSLQVKGTPSPASVVLTHSSAGGSKQVKIEVETKIFAAMSGGTQAYANGTGSVTVASGTHYLERTLSISAENATVVCQRTSSPAGADTGALTNGETIYDSDVLKFTFSAKTGYSIESALLNNKAITNGATHTVSGDVSVAVIATAIKFTLTINQGEGTIIAVNRTSSPKASASLGLLSNGDPIYHSDILNITFNVEFGYDLLTQTINGESASDQDYAVLQDIIVAATAEKTGLVYIDNGSGWEAYEIWIDNGTSWDLYIPYIDDGVAWQQYS